MTTKLTILAVDAGAKSLRIKTDDSVGNYLAKLDSGLKADMVIEANVKKTNYQGKDYWWINEYKSVGNLSSTSQRPQVVTQAPYWLAGASNICANAITTGLIKEPEEIKAWVLAWKDAAEGDPSS